MIWMDSYAKIHALTLSWVACDDDLTDWTDEALWPFVSHADMETMMWAMSAFMMITSTPPPDGVTPCTYWLACRIIADKIEQAIKTRLAVAEGCP